MTLAKRDILQVNSTIIAGLLILLTIQTTVSSFEIFDSYSTNQGKIGKLTELIKNSNDTNLNEKANERIIELKIFQTELLEDAERDSPLVNSVQNIPMILFVITMIPFIGACVWEMHDETKGSFESSTRPGRIMTYAGFVFLFLATFFLVLIRLST